jgi:hypothetical protein
MMTVLRTRAQRSGARNRSVGDFRLRLRARARALCVTARAAGVVCAAAFITSEQAARAGTNAWTSQGPNGGLVPALAIDPHTPTTLYAGTYGGVFKSTDAASTWSAVNAGLTNPGVHALAIDPLTPGRLYAGTFGAGVFAIQQVETPTPTPTSTQTSTRTPTATPVGGAGSGGCTLTPSAGDGGPCAYFLVPMLVLLHGRRRRPRWQPHRLPRTGC